LTVQTGVGNTTEKNPSIFPNPNVLIAVSKGM